MARILCPVAAFLFLGITSLRASDVDFTVAGGAGSASGNARTNSIGMNVSPAIGGTFRFTGTLDFLHLNKVAVGLEIPLALYGSRSADVFAQGSYASVYTERITAALTPGIRVRFAPAEHRISPWLSFGTGMAVIHRTGNDFQFAQPFASQIGSSRVLALAPAAGADIRLAPRWFARLEMRSYLYQTPSTGFVSSFAYWNRWNHKPVLAAGIGYRFR